MKIGTEVKVRLRPRGTSVWARRFSLYINVFSIPPLAAEVARQCGRGRRRRALGIRTRSQRYPARQFAAPTSVEFQPFARRRSFILFSVQTQRKER